MTHPDYLIHTTLPAYESAIWEGEGRDKRVANPDALKWSGDPILPTPVGSVIWTRIGPCVVTGYFEQGGWLGLLAAPLAPRLSWRAGKWGRRDFDHIHIFGAELGQPQDRDVLAEAGIDAETLGEVQMYALKHGDRWKAKLLDDWMHARLCGPIHKLRNTHGPSWLDDFVIPTTEG